MSTPIIHVPRNFWKTLLTAHAFHPTDLNPVNVASYKWELKLIKGNGNEVLTSPLSATTQVENLRAFGQYLVTLTITSIDGIEAAVTKELDVDAPAIYSGGPDTYDPCIDMPQPNDQVQDMVYDVTTHTMYVVGFFTTVTDQHGTVFNRTGAFAFNVFHGTVLPWDPKLNDDPNAVLLYNGKVILAGYFVTSNGVPAHYVAAFDAITGVLDGTTGGVQPNNFIDDITIKNSTLYLVGRFTDVNEQSRGYGAAIDLTDWSLLAWDPRSDSELLCVGVLGTKVFCGGFPNTVQGYFKNNVFACNSVTGDIIPDWDAFVDDVLNTGNGVYDLAVDETYNRVYITGFFYFVGGVPHTGYGAVDADTGAFIAGFGKRIETDSFGQRVVVLANRVYFGGYFQEESANNDAGGWTLIAVDRVTGILQNIDYGLFDIAYAVGWDGTYLYAGGSFNQAHGNTLVSALARLDADSGQVAAPCNALYNIQQTSAKPAVWTDLTPFTVSFQLSGNPGPGNPHTVVVLPTDNHTTYTVDVVGQDTFIFDDTNWNTPQTVMLLAHYTGFGNVGSTMSTQITSHSGTRTTSIITLQEQPYSPGTGTDAGPDQSVAFGANVTLAGNDTSFLRRWNLISFPVAINTVRDACGYFDSNDDMDIRTPTLHNMVLAGTYVYQITTAQDHIGDTVSIVVAAPTLPPVISSPLTASGVVGAPFLYQIGD